MGCSSSQRLVVQSRASAGLRATHLIRAAAGPGRAGVACLDGKTGRTLWLSDCRMRRPAIRFGITGGCSCSRSGWPGGQFASPLCLVELNPETGDVLFQQQLSGDGGARELPGECQASWAGNRLVVLVAGSVICADLQGRIVWLRQETALPYTIDPAFIQQHCQPAIESDGRLFVQQPGSCVIDCLALETGQRGWRRGILGLKWMVDLPDDRLLARTMRGLVALSKATGEVLWQREFPDMLSPLARTSSGLILCARQAVVDGKPQVVFLWIDPASGQTRAHGLMPLDKSQPILFGPIATAAIERGAALATACGAIPPRRKTISRSLNCAPASPPWTTRGRDWTIRRFPFSRARDNDCFCSAIALSSASRASL